MAELFLTADIGIGASGSTTWERCCLGLPSILMALAANQEIVGNGGRQAGIAEYLGRIEDVDAQAIRSAITVLDGAKG